MTLKPTAMVSSTVHDLGPHRQRAEDACREADFFPKLMKDLYASDRDAMQASRGLVDDAEIFIGLYAFRYGHVPDGQSQSITEMELDRALERQLPILAFLMDPAYARDRTADDTDPALLERLAALKARVSHNRFTPLFGSPEHLGWKIVSALLHRRLDEAMRLIDQLMAARKRDAKRMLAQRKELRAVQDLLAALQQRPASQAPSDAAASPVPAPVMPSPASAPPVVGLKAGTERSAPPQPHAVRRPPRAKLAPP